MYLQCFTLNEFNSIMSTPRKYVNLFCMPTNGGSICITGVWGVQSFPIASREAELNRTGEKRSLKLGVWRRLLYSLRLGGKTTLVKSDIEDCWSSNEGISSFQIANLFSFLCIIFRFLNQLSMQFDQTIFFLYNWRRK